MRDKLILLLIAFTLCMPASARRHRTQPEQGWVLGTCDTSGRYHGVPMANGTIGLMPGRDPFSVKGVILGNTYDGQKRQGVSRIANSLNPFQLSMCIDGEPVTRTSVSGWRQTLDMRHARLDAMFTQPGKAEICYTLRALRNMPHAALVTVSVKALGDISLDICQQTLAPKDFQSRDSALVVREIHGPRYTIVRHWAKTPYRGICISASAALFDAQGPAPQQCTLAQGQSYTFCLLGAVCTDQDFSDPLNESDREVIYGIMEGADKLIGRHEAMWDELWQGDIVIDGDPRMQEIVRASLYQLYSSCREGASASIPPFGFSSREYSGHIFWDSEIWMYPPMLMLNAGIARSMVDYRTDRLAPALRRADAYGYKGAMFPWESDFSGEEACPTDALTGTFEHHITADVAIAAWNYYCMTGDRAWLGRQGWPLLEAVAQFWVSRVERNADGSYSIRNVVCADEFAEGVDDNAFTNGSAIRALRAAVRAAELTGHAADPRWTEVADGLRILRAADGTSLEYEGYDGQIIKQADANLLAYPLQIVTDPDDIRRDLAYYEDKMHPGGPMMSFAILALQWARLGDGQRAGELLQKTLEGHVRPPFCALSETAGHGDTFFVTGCGGLLQAMINGFCGLELTEQGIVQLPSALPPHWKSITVKGVGPDRLSFTRCAGR